MEVNQLISPRIESALNSQINLEMQSAYVYLGMSLDMHRAGFTGASHWLRSQYDEETKHAFKIIDYVQDQFGVVQLQAIDSAGARHEQPIDAFRAALEHEKKVTESINNVLGIAQEEGDAATESLMTWFVDEQVEEESTTGNVVKRLEVAGSNSAALLLIDSELGGRDSG